ncbi:hypothetical protein CLOM_g10989 [Closterium sp. NIES-68]|nr:hypothetical protein CLOM_g10989 [Closterium sp. NIES-68]GJP71159.1 hypothetical protein CLOP_g2006 [Closterium sp. NIES-67]
MRPYEVSCVARPVQHAFSTGTPLCSANRGAFFQLSEKVTKWCDSVEAAVVQWIIDFVATRAIALFVLLNPRLSSHQQFRLHQMMSKAVERSWLRRKVDVRLLKGILALACPNRDLLNLIDYLSETAASLCDSQISSDLQLSPSDICLHPAPCRATCQPDPCARTQSPVFRPPPVPVNTPPQSTATSTGRFTSSPHLCSGASILQLDAKTRILQSKHCPEVAISIGAPLSCYQAEGSMPEAFGGRDLGMGAASLCSCTDLIPGKEPGIPLQTSSLPRAAAAATTFLTTARTTEGKTGLPSAYTARESDPSTLCQAICHSQPLLRSLQQTRVPGPGYASQFQAAPSCCHRGTCHPQHPLAAVQPLQSQEILRVSSRLATTTAAAATTVPPAVAAAAAAVAASMVAPVAAVSSSPPLVLLPRTSILSQPNSLTNASHSFLPSSMPAQPCPCVATSSCPCQLRRLAVLASPSVPAAPRTGAVAAATACWWLLTEWFIVDRDLVAAMPPAVQRSVLEGLCGDHMDGMLRLVHAASTMPHACYHHAVLPELLAWFREHPPTCCISLEPLVSEDGRVCPDVVAVVQRTRKSPSSGNHTSKQPKLHAFLFRGNALFDWLAVSPQPLNPKTRATILPMDIYRLS